MRSMMKDIVTLTLKDGTQRANVRAVVDSRKIILNDVSIPISIGDRISRLLPSGREESLIVTDYHLHKGGRAIPDFYEITYEREELRTHQPQPRSVSVHVEGSPQARVTLNAADQSVNVISSEADNTFEQVRNLLRESIADVTTLDVLLSKVDDMERSQGTDDFKTAYKDFVSAAADHITILAPVLPMLAAIL